MLQIQHCHTCVVDNKQDKVNKKSWFYLLSVHRSYCVTYQVTISYFYHIWSSVCATQTKVVSRLWFVFKERKKKVKVCPVPLPDGGGDTDRHPGSGSVRGVAAGTHHCRMAQRSSARLGWTSKQRQETCCSELRFKLLLSACWQTYNTRWLR